jgi:short-subunit dehydrogenase
VNFVSNKLVIVSGGSRGIGRAIVEKFTSEGFDVAVSARNEAKLLELQQFIESKYSVKCHIHPADLSIKKEVEGFVEFIKKLNQAVEVLVNNVGQFATGDVHNAPEGLLESQIDTNLYSAFYLTRGLIEGMIDKKNGHIFNICSIASLKTYPKGSLYSISKFAMLGFSKALIEEMRPYGISVTSIIPGAVRTDSWNDEEVDNQAFIEPKEIAEVIWENYKSKDKEEILIIP